jgi:CRISPR-associated endonuclease/helicase Cas3
MNIQGRGHFMNRHNAIAHVAEDGRCHDLYEHLAGTAKRSGEAAHHFDSAAWAELAGLWHDLGKYSKAFQDMIRSASGIDAHIETQPGRVDHSTAGALLAMREFGKAGFPLAFVIAGHHAGLADKVDLEARLEAKHDLLGKALAMDISRELLAVAKLSPPSFLQAGTTSDAEERARSQEFWVRMLYSALVDADFLDTEAFHDISAGNRHVQNRSMGEPLVQLKDKFDRYMTKKQEESDDTPINRIRAEVLKACREKAVMPQGVYSLTAPTGAGKTLAAMGFALNHAIFHGLRRVIVVIPYTSIIEQNAGQYREVFGDANVVEHHANLDPEKENHRNRLACENWDAPIVVTTSVQFMESLLANRSSRCRKLHNIVHSVLIFDEVQTLPIGHLIPILDLLKELVKNYRVSIVLSTATQPALGQRPSGLAGRFPGFERIEEVVPDPIKTFESLKRVDVAWPYRLDEPITWGLLAEDIRRNERVLTIVHRREDARTLARLLPEGTFHLSALMCAAHRSQVIGKIRSALRISGPVRVVSTQLVEAGVDLDFPVVYRAFGGLDSIAQAAGRCNREGRLPGKGLVQIFVAPTNPPQGTPRIAAQVTEGMLAERPNLDPLRPDVFERYFRQLYFIRSRDAQGIQADRRAFKFKTVAEKFRMIEDDGSEPVLVPFEDASQRLDALRRFGLSRDRLRAIQPFLVTLYPQQIQALERAGALETIGDTVRALLPTHAYLYDATFGLVLEGSLAADPRSLLA